MKEGGDKYIPIYNHKQIPDIPVSSVEHLLILSDNL